MMKKYSLENKPSFVTDEHLTFLDELRDSGVVNMYGATSHIRMAFGLKTDISMKILQYWMDTYLERHPK